MVLMVLTEAKVQLDPPVLPVLTGLLVPTVSMQPMVPRDHRVRLAIPVNRDNKVTKAKVVPVALAVTLVPMVSKVTKGCEEIKAPRVKLVPEELKEELV